MNNELSTNADFSGEDLLNSPPNDFQDPMNGMIVPHEAYLSNSAILNHPDPLLYADKYEMPKCNLHTVKPHYVNGYVRADGTVVSGYWRDGETGTGYLRSNPDDTTANNLK